MFSEQKKSTDEHSYKYTQKNTGPGEYGTPKKLICCDWFLTRFFNIFS